MLRPYQKRKTCAHADVSMNCHGTCAFSRKMVWSSNLQLHEISIARKSVLNFNLVAACVILWGQKLHFDCGHIIGRHFDQCHVTICIHVFLVCHTKTIDFCHPFGHLDHAKTSMCELTKEILVTPGCCNQTSCVEKNSKISLAIRLIARDEEAWGVILQMPSLGNLANLTFGQLDQKILEF